MQDSKAVQCSALRSFLLPDLKLVSDLKQSERSSFCNVQHCDACCVLAKQNTVCRTGCCDCIITHMQPSKHA